MRQKDFLERAGSYDAVYYETPYELIFPPSDITEELVREINDWNKLMRNRHLDLMVLKTISGKKGVSARFYANKKDYQITVGRLKAHSFLERGVKFYASFIRNGKRFPIFANLDGMLVSDSGAAYLLGAQRANQELTQKLQQARSAGEISEQLKRAETAPGSYFVTHAIFERGLTKRNDHFALYEGLFGDYLSKRF